MQSCNYREKAYRINMVKEHLPWFLLAAAQGLLLVVLNLLEFLKYSNYFLLEIAWNRSTGP
jgi:hypothetical protein